MEQLRKNSAYRFIESILNGVGNLAYQTNPLSGLLILIGMGLSSLDAAINFAVGAALTNVAAIWVYRADRGKVDAGAFAWIGGAGVFLAGAFMAQDVPTASVQWILLVVLAALLAVPVKAGLDVIDAKLKISSTALPFMLIMWAVMAAALYTDLPGYSVAPQVLPANPDTAAPYTWQTFLYAPLSGLGMLTAQNNPITGAFILAAIFINSRISGLMAVAGGLIPVLLGYVFGYDEETLRGGVLSLNPILTAIALGGYYYYFSWRSAAYALLGAVFSLWAYLVLAALLNPLGLPALVIGFVVAAWFMMLGAQGYDVGIKPVPMHRISRPEDHLKHLKETA
jgi:urea transporter